MIAGGPFGAEAFAGFLEDSGTPPGLVFSTMRHNRANGSIGVSNTRTGRIESLNSNVGRLSSGNSDTIALHKGNTSSTDLNRGN